MKVLRGILYWLSLLLSLVGGVVLLYWVYVVRGWFHVAGESSVAGAGPASEAKTNDVLQQVEQIWNMSLASGVIGAAILCSVLCFLWASIRSLKQKSARQSLVFQDDQGKIRVSVKALQESLARSLRSLPEVHDDMRVTIQTAEGPGPNPVTVVATGSVYQDSDLNRVGDKIRETLRHHFQGMLRLEDTVKFEVDLQRIISRDTASEKSLEEPESPKPEEPDTGSPEDEGTLDYPISGPVYPVEAENEGEEWEDESTRRS